MNRAEYDTLFEQETAHWWYRGLRRFVDFALDDASLPPAARILDIGCGTGANAVHAGARGQVTCLDFSSVALRRCRERGLARLIRGSAMKLPIDDSRFDVALLLDVLYHREVGDPAFALREVRRVLRPGGVAIVNVPAYEWMRASHDDAVHTARRFTRSGLRRMLEAAGFRTTRCTYWNTALFPAIVVKRKLLGGKSDSDTVERFAPGVERCFDALLRMEAAVVRRVSLPFGLSIFAVARKT